MEYHKINSIFKRDMTKKSAPFILDEWADPAFEYLKDNPWEWTEKIDGTNIRVMFDGNRVSFGGKTEAASIPAHLFKRLEDIFLPKQDALKEMFGEENKDVCLYGEGFGYKIQGKAGSDYLGNEVDFYLFDIRVGKWWLERENVYNIGQKLGLRLTSVVGTGTIAEAVVKVKEGFKSAFGDVRAEGLVLRPLVELQNRGGQRVITKIKCRDFQIES